MGGVSCGNAALVLLSYTAENIAVSVQVVYVKGSSHIGLINSERAHQFVLLLLALYVLK